MSTLPPRIVPAFLLWLGVMTLPAKEPVYRVDFTVDLDVIRILREAPVFKQTTGSPRGHTYYFAEGLKVKERQYVFEIKLPEKGVLKLRSNLATLLAKDGIVTRLTFNSGIMPLEEAHQAALEISTMMNLQTDRIAVWYKEASKLKGPRTCLLMSRTYPEVAIEVRSSINTVYPYMLTAEISWTDDRGGAKLPPPFPEPMTISLDPPSGKIYDPAEMWGDPGENARQMELWMKHHPERAEEVRRQIERQKQKQQARPSSADAAFPSAASTAAPVDAANGRHHWKWVLAGLFALAAGVILLWRRMRA